MPQRSWTWACGQCGREVRTCVPLVCAPECRHGKNIKNGKVMTLTQGNKKTALSKKKEK